MSTSGAGLFPMLYTGESAPAVRVPPELTVYGITRTSTLKGTGSISGPVRVPRTITGALNWDLPWIRGLSLDLAYESTSDRVADRANSFVIPPRYVVALGGRYRFELLDKPATFRAQVASVNNVYGYSNLGEGFYYNQPRRFQMSLTVDL